MILDSYSKKDIESIMNVLKDCDYNENVCEIIVNKDVLKNKTIDEQIELMKNIKNEKQNVNNKTYAKNIKTYAKDIKEIGSIKELKKYLDTLKNQFGPKADIKLDNYEPLDKKSKK